MGRTLIHGAVIVTALEDASIPNGYLIIEGNRLAEVGSGEYTGTTEGFDRVIDAKGKLAMPGLINTHGHAAMTLLRGYADDLPLQTWLEDRCWPIEAKMTDEDIYWGTQLAILEMLKGGTTTFTDMYFSMDRVAEAAKESGIRACLSRGIIGFPPDGEKKLAEAISFSKEYHGQANNRITVTFGPHAPYTCPPDFMKKVVSASEELNLPIQIHLSETAREVAECVEQHGVSPIKLMEELGVFNRPTLAAHCVHLSDEDIEIMAKYDVRVAHNPDSNLKLGSGIAPVLKMLEKGLTVGLGTDGAASNNNLDMFEEMRMAAMLHKGVNQDAIAVSAFKALEMATTDGARALFLEESLGTLQAGALADVLLLDIEQPHFYPRHNMIAHLVYSAGSRDVTHVFVDGELVVEDRKVLTMDEQQIYAEVQRVCERLYAE
ncbi:N-ethylammeline chlorohydrolase [Tumebacillus algifaecis]|uniref:5-methylthioadenosine/S-adenosylhomocysteine deaminase n=1 Tax=Tumebacillus algifaecis TaxID=1214604 RepID=A0A223D0J3_9BACL|nr:amidohydrolase [Tumebacillus algifaecis]ASS75279.1 N-ethylammeline chlorohydrolase [Tumebacillus algifaecis]